ncbi:hypothetical protein TNCV_1340701 [Trichonephila clavipes]|nr:hypothetical protein TNCV_1340701 [Trichonephila clavipes]
MIRKGDKVVYVSCSGTVARRTSSGGFSTRQTNLQVCRRYKDDSESHRNANAAVASYVEQKKRKRPETAKH